MGWMTSEALLTLKSLWVQGANFTDKFVFFPFVR